MNDNVLGIMILLGIIAIAAFGGAKNSAILSAPTSVNQNQTVEQKIAAAQVQVADLQKQIKTQEEEKTWSKYKSSIRFQYLNRSSNPAEEYVALYVDQASKTNIPITGWTIKSTSNNNSVTIPKASYLFFTNSINSEDNVILAPGEIAYIVTGFSPVGVGFKANKCSGYLSQFQTFIPYLSTQCPYPRDEDLSSIPKRLVNEECLDYINSFPNCRAQNGNLPANYTYECTNFIATKLTYTSCVDTHKNDADFSAKEWRIYLKRSEKLWKTYKDTITLYDSEGKYVDSMMY